MPIVFALKGNTSKKVYTGISHSPLEVKGHFHFQGPQPVGCEGGAPEWVAAAFDNNPKLNMVALSYEDSGVVYSRMKE